MKHSGGCHCGNVRYEVELKLDKMMACNCSICSKRGHFLSFTPDTKFQLLKGEDSLTDYLFNTKSIHHFFCKICGVGSFGKATMPDGTVMAAINVRCLDGVKLQEIPVEQFDGKSR
jgi:hypothetical protein